MKKRICLITSILILVISACVEKFDPELEKYENVLIIDGVITNKNEYCKIKISRSHKYGESEPINVSNASVKVIDNKGNEYIFEESEPGEYIDKNELFEGVPGNSYKVKIKLNDESTYESGFQQLTRPVPIDSITYQFENKNINGIPQEGVQLYVDVLDAENKADYYSWEYSETWEFLTPYVNSRFPELNRCFKSSRSKNTMLTNTTQSMDQKVIKHPLYFISTETNRLTRRYSVLLKQYSLTEENYQFLKNLKTTNESAGSLFDPTPIMVEGNVESISNPENAVFGFIQVAGVSEKRIFIDRSELPKNLSINFGFESCKVVSFKVEDSVSIKKAVFNGKIIMDTILVSPYWYVRLVNYEACYDCTLSGTKKVPEFWQKK